MEAQPDPAQVSQAVDALARSILAQRIQTHKDKPERLRKLEFFKQQFDALLLAQHNIDGKTGPKMSLDVARLDSELQQGLTTLERDGGQYVLLPLSPGAGLPQGPAGDAKSTFGSSKKKKKSKLSCSFCNTQGHTRAHCEKRKLAPKP
ncbi:LADA_0F09384g1_1 [Lachancea dasiensis]|uniref:LADA_0F09384g1_1 n=1 Tax=Lachancea dasiensis TaxID=1072105 RepID=A0A1G4JLX0_9SACH|nr:LADA_0F09384g1_1 [Lachancea dasiensis]